jgi:hypothetical protein
VINRAIYEIAFLHVPGQPLPDPWTRTAGWNGRLVYSFGGGCSAGYRQGGGASALSDVTLAAGYASAASSLNVFGNNCDDVISAETLMMVKEHFVEQFGSPVHTIGTGGSGGSMQPALDRAELPRPARRYYAEHQLSRSHIGPAHGGRLCAARAFFRRGQADVD